MNEHVDRLALLLSQNDKNKPSVAFDITDMYEVLGLGPYAFIEFSPNGIRTGEVSRGGKVTLEIPIQNGKYVWKDQEFDVAGVCGADMVNWDEAFYFNAKNGEWQRN